MQFYGAQVAVAGLLLLLLRLGAASPRGLFMNDKDIENFLRLYNTDVMLWSCKNGIDFKYKNFNFDKVLASISLKCDVLGVPSSIRIEHNFAPVKGKGKRYQLLVGPHFEGSKMFYDWKEYTLKILDPTAADSGLYRIFVRGPSGKTQQQLVYVNLKRYEPLLAKVKAENRRLQSERTVVKPTHPYLTKQMKKAKQKGTAKGEKRKEKKRVEGGKSRKNDNLWLNYH